MIYDSLNNASLYRGVHPGVAAGLALLRDTDFSSWPDGDTERPGGLIVKLSTYMTKPVAEIRPETHRRYIDIQCLLTGRERVLWLPRDEAGEPVEQAGADMWFHAAGGTEVPLEEGRFIVLFPEDAHGPCVAWGAPQMVRKVVIKVPLDD